MTLFTTSSKSCALDDDNEHTADVECEMLIIVHFICKKHHVIWLLCKHFIHTKELKMHVSIFSTKLEWSQIHISILKYCKHHSSDSQALHMNRVVLLMVFYNFPARPMQKAKIGALMDGKAYFCQRGPVTGQRSHTSLPDPTDHSRVNGKSFDEIPTWAQWPPHAASQTLTDRQ